MPTTAIDLAGAWRWTDLSDGRQVAAQVPGCVHRDLRSADVLPDLWWRDNERQWMWVAERDWALERRFTLTLAASAADRLVLVCDGLDTVAEVEIDGRRVITADNMFRRWEADLTGLAPGDHVIRIVFRSTLPVIAAGQARRALHQWNVFHQPYVGAGHLRKMACSYGWDWGPMVPTCGVWRGIRIEARQGACLGPVRIRQDHTGAAVSLVVDAPIEDLSVPDATITVAVRLGRTLVAAGVAGKDLPIPDPQLWWPAGQGAQPLYDVTLTLCDPAGRVLDRAHRRIGLRTIALVQDDDAWGRSFAFAVNGRRIFVSGANWVPADIFPSDADPVALQRVADAAAAGMTMLRVWGGGIYESDAFYDACDAAGILIWQDFAFACTTYPLDDPAFRANVAVEAAEQIARLRHHPSLALWCGNNELEQGLVGPERTDRQMSWQEYGVVFDAMLPRLVAEGDGERPYWPGSPHSPVGERKDFNSPRSGDAHNWSVWFGWASFEQQRAWDHRFQSEFGFQSFPEPRTIARFAAPSDRILSSYVMDYHQRSLARGNKTILAYIADYFPVPMDPDELFWMTQLSQAECVRIATEHARRSQPRCMGSLYWQLNDLWPAATWSSIDVLGRWKALHYAAAHFNAPTAVSLVEDAAAGQVAVHVSHLGPDPTAAVVAWTVTDAGGATLGAAEERLELLPQTAVRAVLIDLAPIRGGRSDRDLLIWAEVRVRGRVRSRGLATLARWKHLELRPQVRVRAEVTAAARGLRIRLHADAPALFVRLELDGMDARWTDNHLHLGMEAVEIICHPERPLTPAALRRRLRITPLNRHLVPPGTSPPGRSAPPPPPAGDAPPRRRRPAARARRKN
jgi:beta-mannosidase